MLGAQSALEVLDLVGHNPIGDAGWLAAGSVGRMPRLATLDLSETGLTDAGLAGLARGLLGNTTLTTLQLQQNRFRSDGGVLAVARWAVRDRMGLPLLHVPRRRTSSTGEDGAGGGGAAAALSSRALDGGDGCGGSRWGRAGAAADGGGSDDGHAQNNEERRQAAAEAPGPAAAAAATTLGVGGGGQRSTAPQWRPPIRISFWRSLAFPSDRQRDLTIEALRCVEDDAAAALGETGRSSQKAAARRVRRVVVMFLLAARDVGQRPGRLSSSRLQVGGECVTANHRRLITADLLGRTARRARSFGGP